MRSTNRSAGVCVMDANGSARTSGCSRSGKYRIGTTKPPRNSAAANAIEPRPRASVVQNADTLSRKAPAETDDDRQARADAEREPGAERRRPVESVEHLPNEQNRQGAENHEVGGAAQVSRQPEANVRKRLGQVGNDVASADRLLD